MGSINAVPSYTSYYNLPKEGNSGTGIVFAIFQIGQMTGAFFSWVSDWHGRRWPIFIGCFGTCVGAIVTSVAPTIPAFIGGRFLLSFFSTIATAAAPLYLIEIAPPQHRGTVAGLYNTLYYLVGVLSRLKGPLLIFRARLLPRLLSTVPNSAGVTMATSLPGDCPCGCR
jgi:MFS family permease